MDRNSRVSSSATAEHDVLALLTQLDTVQGQLTSIKQRVLNMLPPAKTSSSSTVDCSISQISKPASVLPTAATATSVVSSATPMPKNDWTSSSRLSTTSSIRKP